MPESVTCRISLSFIVNIFAEGYVIMNSPFVAIVPWYALVMRRTVMWSRYRFADFIRLKQILPCIIIHISLYVLSHITAWTHGRPLLPPLPNRGKILTRPLRHEHVMSSYFATSVEKSQRDSNLCEFCRAWLSSLCGRTLKNKEENILMWVILIHQFIDSDFFTPLTAYRSLVSSYM